MAKVLIIRASAFGDVAMLVPVVYSVASRYPQVRFEVMTRQAFTPLFRNLGFNISVAPLDTRKTHRGIWGTMKILGKVLVSGYSHVADVHDVLRSKLIRTVLFLTFARVAKIDKGRREKSEMLKTKDTSIPLEHMVNRYMDVFAKLGFPASIIFENYFDFIPRNFDLLKKITVPKEGDWIGISPFAQHESKIYPLDQMEKVIETLSQRPNTKLFFFGGGDKELRQIAKWAKKYPNIVDHHGKIGLERELLLISYLDVMLSMDSANMHLASLVKVPVVSIWGATHPSLGFYGYKQDLSNSIQIKTSCRPCSVYGDKRCEKEGVDKFCCLKRISPDMVTTKIDQILQSK